MSRNIYALLEVVQAYEAKPGDENPLSHTSLNARSLASYVETNHYRANDILRRELINWLEAETKYIRAGIIFDEDNRYVVSLKAERDAAYESYIVVAKLMDDSLLHNWNPQPLNYKPKETA